MPIEKLPDTLVPAVVKNLLNRNSFFFASLPMGEKAKILYRGLELSQLRALRKWLDEEIKLVEKGKEPQTL